MFIGLIIRESLENDMILNDRNVKIIRIEKWNIGERAAKFQPKIWNAMFIEGKEEKIETIVEKISKSILPKWYANVSNDTTEYVIFHEKIFKHKKGDKNDAKEAISYGKSVGIPANQLDWI